jgi:hypothetical protein
VNLSAPAGEGFSKRAPVVGAWFTGWYLFAIDQRFANDTAFALPGYVSPAAVPPVKLGATAARSAALGPVIGPPAPKVMILRDAILRHGQVLVARVRCSVRCRVWLQVDDNHAGSSAHVKLIGSHLVGIPRRQLRDGPLNVQIYVDSGPLAHGTSQLRGGRLSSARRIPVCPTAALGVRLIHSMAGLGQSGGYLAFTNRSNSTCKLRGWPKLIGLTAQGQATSARDVAAGSVGANVKGVPTVILKFHQRGDAVFAAADGPTTGRGTCPPSYHRLRVTPPGNSKAFVISAWIPYLNAYLPACAGIEVSPIVPSSTLYKG